MSKEAVVSMLVTLLPPHHEATAVTVRSAYALSHPLSGYQTVFKTRATHSALRRRCRQIKEIVTATVEIPNKVIRGSMSIEGGCEFHRLLRAACREVVLEEARL